MAVSCFGVLTIIIKEERLGRLRAHACHPATNRLRQEDQEEFKVALTYDWLRIKREKVQGLWLGRLVSALLPGVLIPALTSGNSQALRDETPLSGPQRVPIHSHPK